MMRGAMVGSNQNNKLANNSLNGGGDIESSSGAGGYGYSSWVRLRGVGAMSALPWALGVHALGLLGILLLVFWILRFREGFGFPSPSDPNRLFNVHPLLMVIGMVFLPAEAILSYKTIHGSKSLRKTLHFALHLVGLIMASIGLYVVFEYHQRMKITDNYSLHSWLGLATIGLFTIQWLMGLFSFVFPKLSLPSRSAILPWHAFVGLCIFGLTIATVEVGLLEKLTFLQIRGNVPLHGHEAFLVNTIGLVLILFSIFVLLVVVIPSS